jgi:hypothetical protein
MKFVKMASDRFGIGSRDGGPPGQVFMEREGIPALGRTKVPIREGGRLSVGRV